MDLRRESDIEQLRRIAMSQQVQIEQLVRMLALKCEELRTLKGSEEELQQTLALVEALTNKKQKEAIGVAADRSAEPKKERKARTKFGPTAQPELEVVPQRFELDEPDRTCPSCGGRLEPMKGQFETSEMIDFVEIQYRLVKVEQQKYRCGCGGCVETAPGPERAQKGGRYSLAFAAKIASDKYLDHLPLARQERILKRHGVQVSSQTLWDQLHGLARRLQPVNEALFEHVVSQRVFGLDQTSWRRLEKGARDKTPWQMWCLTAPRVVVHRIRDDKGKATFNELVGDCNAVIVCDALKTHEAGARDGPMKLAGCWAHVYRKFEEAAPDHPEAHMMLKWIGELYDIDDEAGDSLDDKAELRRARSAQVLAGMKAWLMTLPVLQSLSVGNAAQYTVANWERLTRFVGDPRIPLDNNATERAIRGPVVGRKNHYGSKSRRGTEVAALFYTLIESAKLSGVDPAGYLVEAARAADRGQVLFPWDFAATAS